MITIKGQGVCGGVAFGKLYMLKKSANIVKREKIENVQDELERFENARRDTVKQLESLYNKALAEEEAERIRREEAKKAALLAQQASKPTAGSVNASGFLFPLLASICLMLSVYYRACKDLGQPAQWQYMVFSQAAIFLSMMAMSAGDWMFYGPMTFWLVTDSLPGKETK